MGIEFGVRESISFALQGAHLQHFCLNAIPYGVIFVPRGSWADVTAPQVSRDTGIALPSDSYEVKFDLLSNLKGSQASSFQTRRQAGLSPLSMKELNILGSALLASIELFHTDYQGSGYYGQAVAGNPKLCHYYKRLFRTNLAKLCAIGLTAHTSAGGNSYAFLPK